VEKYFPLDRLADIIRAERSRGRSIVLANGCFDLIHVGHIRYLEGAKAQGDILVAALNSDASVRRLKGEGRPILPASERAEILAAFSCVDFVTIFEEDTVEKVLLTLKPEVHAKGSDYTTDSVPERATVRSYGGKIAITGGAKVKNTSQLIREIGSGFKHE
jgi:rfaE bifunctional protein nucleotidyltransferase chain/domain